VLKTQICVTHPQCVKNLTDLIRTKIFFGSLFYDMAIYQILKVRLLKKDKEMEWISIEAVVF